MVCALAEVWFRSGARRARRAAAASPAGAALAGLAFASLPALALWAGTRASETLGAALAGDPALARSLALAGTAAAALAGSALTILGPTPRLLGTQLRAAPVSRLAAFAGLTVLPLAAVLAAIAVPLVLFVAPLARGAAVFVLAAALAALALGAAAAEAVLALARQAPHGLAIAAGVVVLCAADPLAPAAAALHGEPAATAFAFAAAGAALWLVSAYARPAERAARGQVRVRARGSFACALARYGRRSDLRRHAFATLAFAALGSLALRSAGTPADVVAALAGATAVLGASVLPLAAPGVDARADWLWRTAPVRQLALRARFALAAITVGAGVAAAGVAAALAAAAAPPRSLAPLAGAACVLFGAALLAGTLVHWRGDGASAELAALLAFGAVASAWSFALAQAAEAAGAADGVRAAALAGSSLAAAVGLAALAAARRRE